MVDRQLKVSLFAGVLGTIALGHIHRVLTTLPDPKQAAGIVHIDPRADAPVNLRAQNVFDRPVAVDSPELSDQVISDLEKALQNGECVGSGHTASECTIRAVRKALAMCGEEVEPEGGKVTHELRLAIGNFQRHNGLKRDCAAGPKTLSTLIRRLTGAGHASGNGNDSRRS